MTRKLAFVFLILFITSCGTSKRTTSTSERKVTIKASPKTTEVTENSSTNNTSKHVIKTSKADEIINTALGYSGVRYKYGGTTNQGMDCSGLLYTAFAAHDFSLPRVSYVMAEEGKRIPISKVSKGDLLFFKTSKKGRRINHVGLVVTVEGDDIKFIHATSSRGVIVSSLREGFWNYAFVRATRVL